MHDLSNVPTIELLNRSIELDGHSPSYCACEEGCIWDNWYFIDKELGGR